MRRKTLPKPLHKNPQFAFIPNHSHQHQTLISPNFADQMATEDDNKDGRTETNAVESPTMALNWKEKLENRYRELKEHAETYPYVWASYIVVYGGFAIWTTYRWRKLRKTEDRVRALQERLRKIVEEQEGGGGGGAASSKP